MYEDYLDTYGYVRSCIFVLFHLAVFKKNLMLIFFENTECFTSLMFVCAKEKAEYRVFGQSFKSNLDDQTIKPDEFGSVCDILLYFELDAVNPKYENKFSDIFKVYRTEQN